MSNPLAVSQAAPWESDSDPAVHAVRLTPPKNVNMSLASPILTNRRQVLSGEAGRRFVSTDVLGVSFLVEEVSIVLLLALWTQTVAEVCFGVLGDIGFKFLPASALVADAFAPHTNRKPSPKDFDFPALTDRVADEKRQQAEDGDSDERIGGIGGDAGGDIHEDGNQEAAKRKKHGKHIGQTRATEQGRQNDGQDKENREHQERPGPQIKQQNAHAHDNMG